MRFYLNFGSIALQKCTLTITDIQNVCFNVYINYIYGIIIPIHNNKLFNYIMGDEVISTDSFLDILFK